MAVALGAGGRGGSRLALALVVALVFVIHALSVAADQRGDCCSTRR